MGDINRNSKFGIPYEAMRSPVSDDGGFEFRHVCRLSRRTIVGGRDSANSLKGRPVIHLAKIAYSGSPDEPQINRRGWARRRLGCNQCMLVWETYHGGFRIASDLAWASAGGYPWIFCPDSIRRSAIRGEDGCGEDPYFVRAIMSDVYPEWIPWVVRGLVYSFLGFKPGPHGEVARDFRGSSAGALCGYKARKPSYAKWPVGPSQEYGDVTCFDGLFFMDLGRNAMSRSQGEWPGAKIDNFSITQEDMKSPHLPFSARTSGARMCPVRRDMYYTLKGSLMCSLAGFTNLGSMGSSGLMFCSSQIAASVAPTDPHAAEKIASAVEKGIIQSVLTGLRA